MDELVSEQNRLVLCSIFVCDASGGNDSHFFSLSCCDYAYAYNLWRYQCRFRR